MAKQYKNHDDVSHKYKWDLSFLLEGNTPEKVLEKLISAHQKMVKIKDSKYDSAKSYLSYLKKEDKLTQLDYKYINYIMNKGNLDVTDPKTMELQQKFQYEMYKIENEIGPEEPRFFKHSAKLKKWAKLPEFSQFKFHIEKSLEEKKYALPKEVQKYNLKVSLSEPDYVKIFELMTNAEIDYGVAKTSKGKEIKITRANKIKLSKHDDKLVRKTSHISIMNAYLKNKGSLASLLFQHKRDESVKFMARGFDGAVEGLIFPDRVKTNLLETLFSSVKDNIKIFKPYRNYYKKFYKAKFKESITDYDWNRPLIKISKEVTVEESIKEVKDALKPFGYEYSKVVENALDNENWVDFMSIDNKLSGAYSIGGSYGIDKKLILMNFLGDMRSTETLAHEMGHSMHSYYSDKVQKTVYNSKYPIFLAEIASIFNELMLHDHWLKTLKDKKLKFKILQQQISGFMATVITQTQWANYEYDLYNKIDKGESMSSYDALSKVYYDVFNQYSTDKPKPYNADKQFYSIYVPHFYYGFYVYKYAIGQLVANIFFAKYKKEGQKALESYIDLFLSAGGHDNPVKILKDAGIDITDPKTYEMGFNNVKTNLAEWIKLGKEIFKVK